MAFQSFASFGALRDEVLPAAVPRPVEFEILRFGAEVEVDDHRAAAKTCRSVLLSWAASRCGGELPPEAAAHRTFSFSDGGVSCEGARVLEADRDLWSVRLRSPDAADSGPGWVTELACNREGSAPTTVRARLLVEGSTFPRDREPRVPDALGRLAPLLDLRQSGEPLLADPWKVDSDAATERLVEVVTDPDRRRPILVLSVPWNEPAPLLDPEPLARATFGLASVVVLPAEYTKALTYRIGHSLAVYQGAVRLYLADCGLDCNPLDHPRFLRERIETMDGKARARTEILRRIARDSLRWQPAWSFWEIREAVGEAPAPADGASASPAGEQPTVERAVAEASPAPEPVAAEPAPEVIAVGPVAGGAAVAPAAEAAAAAPAAEAAPRAVAASPPAVVSPPPDPAPAPPPAPVVEAAAPAPPPDQRAAAAPEEPAPAPLPEAAVAAPAEAALVAVEEPADARSGFVVWLVNRLRLLGQVFSRGRDPLAGDPVRLRLLAERAALEERVKQLAAEAEREEPPQAPPEVSPDVRETREWNELLMDENEQLEARAREAERERDALKRQGGQRVRNLEAQLRRRGQTPHPDTWKDVVDWCRAEFGDALELRPGAVHGLKKAEFDELWLAADCLAWLAGPFRDSRRESRVEPPDIKELDSRLTDGLSGRGVHFPDWAAVERHERRNISRGNARERRKCLRIYYYWDQTSQKVVIVSMPHHARTRAS